MIRVRTPSRLHFGLLNLPTHERWPNLHGQNVVPAHAFGSVGLMVREPGIQLSVHPAAAWSAQGAVADRALAYAQRLAATLPPGMVHPLRLLVEQASPEHTGLGTGTQLALGVGRALALAFGQPHLDSLALARRLGRGERSGIGVHGFTQGGFLVDAGKRTAEEIPPLVARLPFPESWRLVLILPPWGSGLHSVEEQDAFRRLQNRRIPLATTDALCRLVLLGMLPALRKGDCVAFGEALYDFNARGGEVFAPIQGGNYAHRRSGEVVAFVRRQGVPGVGQSSWGPALFAIAPDEDQALHLTGRVREQFQLGPAEVLITRANNDGAKVEILPE